MILGLTLTRNFLLYAIASRAPTAAPTTAPTAAPSKQPVSASDGRQAASATAEGLQVFALAKAIPRLQNFDGASFKSCLDLYYSTCHQTNTVDLSSQQTSFTEA